MARLELGERVEKLGGARSVGGRHLGLVGARVRNEIGDRAVAVADGRLETDRVLHEIDQLLDAFGREPDLRRDLGQRRVAVQLLAEEAPRLRDPPHLIRDVYGEPDRPTLLRERT